MTRIDGRWFLWIPIIIFLIYLGVTSLINEYNSLTNKESKEGFFVVISLVIAAWIFTCGMLSEPPKYTALWFSPVLPFILIFYILKFLDEFFQKHFTVNLKL
jgi:hypothetical protein